MFAILFQVERVNQTLVGLMKNLCICKSGRLEDWGTFQSIAVDVLNSIPRAALGRVLSARELKEGRPSYGYEGPSSSKVAHLIGRKTFIFFCCAMFLKYCVFSWC